MTSRMPLDASPMTIRVIHIIKTLQIGGAEMVLRRLCDSADRQRFEFEVISLTSAGPLGRELSQAGFAVHALDPEGKLNYLTVVPRLCKILRERQPDVVQTWMYHADLIGGLAARLCTSAPIVWGVHAGTPPTKDASYVKKAGLKAVALLSRWLPNRIICCSETTARVHERLGYDTGRMITVPNGFEVLDPSDPKRDALGLPSDIPLVLRVARDHPDKDIPTFLKCIAALRSRGSEAEAVLVGEGLDPGNPSLIHSIDELGVGDCVHLLGTRPDVSSIVASVDVVVSSSSGGEGLPLTIGEAMAAGTPVVTTDVGDSALIVADALRVVPPRDPAALAASVERVLALPPETRMQMGERDRERIREHWSLSGMVEGYCRQYESLRERR